MGSESDDVDNQFPPIAGNFFSARDMVVRKMRSARGFRVVECIRVMP